jgi:NAD(P)-dependent dehydrogenase (short-subunit alcohol dehydrogenase family)
MLVTGATGGLGNALARTCAAQGATMILHGRSVRRLEALYDAIVAAGGPTPAILPLDFATATADQFDEVAGALRAQFGPIDALVHAAAMLGSLGPVAHQSLENWDRVLRVNLSAAMTLTKVLMPLLAEAVDAAIVFTLDSHAFEPRAYWGAYGASKAGLAAAVATLADECEHSPTLRVNAVVPGPIHSPLRTTSHPGEDPRELPRPDALGPLYLELIAGQRGGGSGRVFDGRDWLAGRFDGVPLGAACARP